MSEQIDDTEHARRLGHPPSAEDKLAQMVRSLYETHEKVTLDTIQDIIGDAEPVSGNWDQESEEQMEKQWKDSVRKESSDLIGARGNNDWALRDLWKKCLRFLGQAPPMMLSPLNCLHFVPDRIRPMSIHLFTYEACGDLTQLIVHPIWGLNYRHFIDSLIYSANCRVGGVQNFDWPFFPDDGCPALQLLNEKLTAVEGPRLPNTVHKIHVDARNVVVARGETPGLFSNLLSCIGELATTSKSPSSAERIQLQNGVVPFNGEDLKAIKNAIDSMASSDPRIGYPVQVVHDAFKAAKDTDEKLIIKHLREFDARACKQVLRIAARPGNRGTVSLSPDWFKDEPQATGQPGPSSERVASRSPSPRQAFGNSDARIRSQHRSSSSEDSPTLPAASDLIRRRPTTSAAQIARDSTLFRSTDISHPGSQRDRNPPREQFVSTQHGSMRAEQGRASLHMRTQDSRIEELEATVQNLSRRLTEFQAETDHKVEEHANLIKTLQEENRALKHQMAPYVTYSQSDSSQQRSET
ncbi:hypothetical protein FGADI_2326 [Fusarium gaditjirri]|uniref:Uncharacterized protein n=1 Tax=Fusarium gaditjirri TaxID=282569 RepID=A0A8H4TIM8_9HYPO|nr:hypothetical protein FGADI_2326 [Fusarium gaditjirri]